MRSTGNKRANEVWEHIPPPNKPTDTDPLEFRLEFVKAKYARKEFKKPEKDVVNKNIVFLCWEDEVKWFGFCELDNSEPLSALRTQIQLDAIPLKHKDFLFLFRKAPTTQIQEHKKMMRDCIRVVDGHPTVFLRKQSAP